jgi:hypothetical protein
MVRVAPWASVVDEGRDVFGDGERASARDCRIHLSGFFTFLVCTSLASLPSYCYLL